MSKRDALPLTAPHAPASPQPLLEVRQLSVAYGPRTVVHEVALDVREGEIVALVGANGAGKTSILSATMGLLPARTGEIHLDGQPIQKLRTEQRVARGIALVPEGRQIVPQLTVAENLRIGAYLRRDAGIAGDLECIYANFPRLAERHRQLGGLLSGGEQQMLAIGRALMSRPRLLQLDEPSMGLAPIVIEQIFEIVAGIRTSGTAVLLVEQNARQALTLADRAFVLEQGRVVAAGNTRELATDSRVLNAYLGTREA